MKFPRYVFPACALWFAASLASIAETGNTKNPIQERIEHAQSLQDKGNTEEARKIYESMLPELRSQAPSTQLGYLLNAMSQIEAAQGEYEPAVQSAQESADVYHKLGDKNGEAHALNYKGIAEIEQGNYPAAKVDLEKALTLSRSADSAETEVQILNNLGSAYYFRGKYLEALHNYQDAMALVEQAPKEAWSGYWRQITDFNQATLYQRLGRYEKALQIYRRVESSSKELSSSDRAHLLTNLGALYRRLGDPWKALDSYRSALKLYSKEQDSDGEISVLKNIGIVHALDLDDLVKARQIFEQALSLAAKTHNRREEMQGHLYLGETLLRNNAVEAGRREFERALTAAKELNTTEEQWKALYGLGRTEELIGQLPAAEADYRQALSIIEATRTQIQISALRAEFLADKRDAYDSLIALLLRKNDVPGAFSFLERSRSRTFQDRLAKSAAATVSPTLDEIRKYLDGSTILLEFWASRNQFALIWCTRESYGVLQKQLSSADLGSVLAFVKGVPDNLHDDWREEISALDHLLLPESLLSQSNLRHLLIVPDGWLSFVPFDLLHAGGNSKALLLERFDISYLPTAALLRRNNKRDRPFHFPWTKELVAFGDPTIPRDPSQTASESFGRSGATQRLAYSAQEIHGIAAMTRGRAELFLGPSDRKDIFLGEKANSALLLHVSTHAFANADNPEDSRMLFSSGDSTETGDYVFLRELYDLDLSGVELATLSACDTERGRMIRGEGVQAFSRALLSAGSRSSLTTFWRVGDEPTAEFMKHFYYYVLAKRATKAEALRLAKLKFLNSKTRLENPKYWAAFVLNGDGFNPLPIVISWGSLAACAAGLVTLALALTLWVRSRRERRLYRQHNS